MLCLREIIKDGDSYYNVGPNSYVCKNKNCFNFYFWDDLATKMIFDKNHKYVIVDKEVYQIGSENDEPRGFGGEHWIIQFNDGVKEETNSLWYQGELPLRLQHDFPDNAIFLEKGY